MKKSFLLLCLILTGVLLTAQTNFSGTWDLSKSKSKLNAEFSMAPFKMVIQQEGNIMKLERHSSFQDNEFTSNIQYTLDGNECINEGWQDMKIKSTCVWDNGQKVLTIHSKIPTQDGSEMKITEVYTLINGDFSVNSKASSSWGDFEETWVYEKK
jgi:hypothetical protein